ncbi:MAG: hypothetical protein ACE37H_03280 [Phycisphaeraceae bacterium]
MFHRPIKTLVASARLALVAGVIALAPAALADSIQRGELTFDNITLIGVEDGKLKYRTAGGEREVPLEEVNALVIASVPAFETGLKAFKAQEMRTAQRSFEGIWQDSRVEWIRDYAGYYLAQVYDARNEPVSAGQVYAKLASNNADPFFLSKPPVKSLAEADDDEKNRIIEEIKAVVARSEGKQRDLLQDYLKVVAGDKTVDLDLEPDQDDKAAIKRADSAVFIPEAVWKVLDRRGENKEKWQALDLLAKGEYQAAIDANTKWLSVPGDLPEKLFITARAQLALADAKQDKDLYRDAGLTFMRIVVHFSQQGRTHALVPVAELEVAYIHKQIGREDIYNRLLFGGEDGGGVNLVINDREDYPQYRLRYYQIIGETPPADEDE